MEQKKKPNIFDRLTDTSKYTGAHKERFNADGSGKGKAGRDTGYDPKDLSNMVDSKNKKVPVTTSSPANKTKASPKKDELAGKMKEMKVSEKPTSDTKSKAKQPGIFDRLTDPSKYTGAHKGRFNADGSGKGKAGRDTGYDPKDLSKMVNKK